MSKSRYLPGTGLYSNLLNIRALSWYWIQELFFKRVWGKYLPNIEIGTKLEESCVMNDDGMKP
jgi:hypothetical protein